MLHSVLIAEGQNKTKACATKGHYLFGDAHYFGRELWLNCQEGPPFANLFYKIADAILAVVSLAEKLVDFGFYGRLTIPNLGGSSTHLCFSGGFADIELWTSYPEQSFRWVKIDMLGKPRK